MPLAFTTKTGAYLVEGLSGDFTTKDGVITVDFPSSQIFEVTLVESVPLVTDSWLSDRRVMQAAQLDEVVSIVADAWSSQKIAAGVIKTAAWSEQVDVSEGWVSSRLVITGKVAHIQMLLAKLDIDLTLEKLQ